MSGTATKTYTIRKAIRRVLKIPVVLMRESGEHIVESHTIDISAGGAKLRLDKSVTLPEQFRLSLSDNGDVQRTCRVVWRTANTIGINFVARSSR